MNKALPPGLKASDMVDPNLGTPLYWDITNIVDRSLPVDQARKPYQATDLSQIWLP